MLYNSRCPENKRRRLFLPFLSEEIYRIFEEGIAGGYSTNQAFWAFFNSGYVSLQNEDDADLCCEAEYHDFNQLYGS